MMARRRVLEPTKAAIAGKDEVGLMTLKDDIAEEVTKIFSSTWRTRKGVKVPEAADILLGNEAVTLEGTVMYADLAGSTDMVDRYKKAFSAEVYKAYLYSTAKIIRSEGGVITAYDGDRAMAVFIGDTKNTTAARCALKINWTIKNVVMPGLRAQYPTETFSIRHVVGIDTSELWVARTGIRGANDLVWVGSAANYAAKLTELDAAYPTWITHRVYDRLLNGSKISSDGRNMWEPVNWTSMNNLRIYRSTFWWQVR
jgi:class 3 adenylate cyclase